MFFQTNWIVSLVANSIAISVSTLLSIIYNQNRNKKENDEIYSLWDYLITFTLIFTGAFISYFVVYIFYGYLPMGRETK